MHKKVPHGGVCNIRTALKAEAFKVGTATDTAHATIEGRAAGLFKFGDERGR